MLKTILFTLFLSFSIILSSCTEDKNQSNSSSKADSDLTGKRFFDSASSLVMRNNSGFTRKQGNCVVKAMTADGKYGLGEINQMKLDKESLSGNLSGLKKAYLAATKTCK